MDLNLQTNFFMVELLLNVTKLEVQYHRMTLL